MSYIKKIAKRILAKDYDIIEKDNIDNCVMFLNDTGLYMVKNRRYKYFLYFILTNAKLRCKRNDYKCKVLVGHLEMLAEKFGIKHTTFKLYLYKMITDKILIDYEQFTFGNQAYIFNPEYFDTYLLTDYKTLEE